MTRSRTRPDEGSNGGVIEQYYHVVCHDCRVESLEVNAEDAREMADRHDEKTGHSVTVGRL
ncbi:hypothetical protein [Halopelagius longus]|uniref:DUF1059 domain-containing protein n=1 Tax=Halopelagius longus TaxID=1236180 RepID=A0A1H1B289_9EURY|nr:hypothetical protein [Halopelagius longus]RDI72982.1 hypothetical protein DWB78_02110 [Halopelagius longus]SDQ46044.1 hypothetical protein SAMN05216278_1602 [Halopelagius longus]